MCCTHEDFISFNATFDFQCGCLRLVYSSDESIEVVNFGLGMYCSALLDS
jgi:hypothetical protein